MIIKAYSGGPLQSVTHLVYDKVGGSAVVIDTPLGSTRKIVNELLKAKLKLLYVVNTHGHWDHIADNVPLVRATGATLCAHVWDMTRLAHPEWDMDEKLRKVKVEPSIADRYLHDGETLEVGELRLQVWHTPGHTPGSICLYSEEAGVLFSGDTLLKMGVGRTNIPGGNLRQLTASLLRIATLPDSTRVYPARGTATTIKHERWLLDLAK